MNTLVKRVNLSVLFFLLISRPTLAQGGDTWPVDQTIWETWWFYALVICLLLAIFGLLYQAKARQLQIERAMTAKLREREEALRRSEQQLNEAQDLAKVGSYTWEPDNPTIWSQYMFTLFDVPVGESLSFKRFLSAVKPEDKERVDAAWHSFITSTRTHWELEYRIVSDHGKERTVLAVGKAERDAEGRAVRVVGTVQDITERKQAEDAVRVSEHRYRTLFERTSNAIFVVDKRTGRFADANEAAVQLSGHPLAALRQLTMWDISPERAEAHHSAVSTNQPTDLGRMVYVRPDGTQRIALVNTVPLDDETVFSIARDITNEVRLEEQFREAQKMEAIGRLAGALPTISIICWSRSSVMLNWACWSYRPMTSSTPTWIRSKKWGIGRPIWSSRFWRLGAGKSWTCKPWTSMRSSWIFRKWRSVCSEKISRYTYI
jgi:PAS domain S-box-containing protein